MPQEVAVAGKPAVETVNAALRSDLASLQAKFGGLVADGTTPVGERLPQDNCVEALAVDQGGMSVQKPDTLVDCAPGAVFTKQVKVLSSCRFAGAWFKGAVADALVDVQSTTATAIFVNCRFTKTAGSNGDYVKIANGGKAHFIGCLFDGVQTANNTVNNAGVAGDVFIIGCSRKTTRANVNVTTIAETT